LVPLWFLVDKLELTMHVVGLIVGSPVTPAVFCAWHPGGAHQLEVGSMPRAKMLNSNPGDALA